MIPWKQRLYAFLLRRVLGPILDDASLRQLHASLSVSLTDGSITLQDIALNTDHVNEKLQQQQQQACVVVVVQSIRIEKLTIQLSLQETTTSHAQEEDEHGGMPTTTVLSSTRSSLAWRALQLGSTTTTPRNSSAADAAAASPKVSLVVHVELEGVSVELEPHYFRESSDDSEDDDDTENSQAVPSTTSTTTKSMLSSYLDAALASLQLSVNFTNLSVRLWSKTSQQPQTSLSSEEKEGKQEGDYDFSSSNSNLNSWIQVQCQAVSYQSVPTLPRQTTDPTPTTNAPTAALYETTLHKVLQLQQITFFTGTTRTTTASSKEPGSTGDSVSLDRTMALVEGSTRIIWRVIEYPNGGSSSSTHVSSLQPQPPHVQQDVQITLHNKVNVSVDAHSLAAVQQVVHGMQSAITASTAAAAAQHNTTIHNRPSKGTHHHELVDEMQSKQEEEEEDVSTLTSIMRQYQEARQRVERNEVRGGILIPSSDDGEDLTFEAFFDANDASVYHYSTLLRESILVGAAKDSSGRIHTKFSFHLHKGGIKIVLNAAESAFNSLTSSTRHEEYVLLTFSDCNLSSLLSNCSSEYLLSIDRIEIEDSLLVSSTVPDLISTVEQVEIGSLLRFSSSVNDAAGGDADILVQSPCLSLNVNCHRGETDFTEMELELDPIEITYRSATIQKLTRLFVELATSMESPDDDRPLVVESPKKSISTLLRFSAACPSLTVGFPVVCEREWTRLYDRCGYICGLTQSSRSSLMVHFENLAIDMNANEVSANEDTVLSFRNIFFFCSSPETRGFLENRACRFDILALCGRAEVEPCIPVSIRLWRNALDANDDKGTYAHPGATTFPNVSPISSFKARQEDEDEDNRVDRILCSKMRGVDVSTRKQLRGADPQAAMLANASHSDIVVTVDVPEIICDLTMEEILLVHEMALGLFPPEKESDGDETAPVEPRSPGKRVAFVFACEEVSAALHEDLTISSNDKSYSFVLKTGSLKTHALIHAGRLQQNRFLVQDFHFCQVTNLVRPIKMKVVADSCDRIDLLRQRCSRLENSITTPIFYRSQLFEPISRSSPALLVDLICPQGSSDHDDLVQQNLHVTLYDVTHRYDYDGRDWIGKLEKLLASRSTLSVDAGVDKMSSPRNVLTRLFLSVADSNIDYTSSTRFNTASRAIVRLGDLRFSSNIVFPAAPTQAFSLSIGDVAVYVCSNRFPYHFENARLVGSKALMHTNETSLGGLTDLSSEAHLHRMNYRTVLMLDTLDSVIAVSNVKPKKSSDPYFRISLTVGEVGLYVCKDSFARLMNTIGELSTEMTALDEAAFEALKARPAIQPCDSDTFYDSLAEEARDELPSGESAHLKYYALDDLKRQSALRPTRGTDNINDHSKDFLLDGYDWTAIDVDETNALGIPAGEEQASRWYSSGDKADAVEVAHDEEVSFLAGNGSSAVISPSRAPRRHQGPRIITHHFPLHPVSDPLGDGDMGASKYAGSTTPPQVKTRVLVHDLTVKLRCFDGFDWPELLSEESRSLPRKGPFIIDDVDLDSKNTATGSNTNKQASSTRVAKPDKRSKLMGDLLSGQSEISSTFKDVPLPEEKGRSLREQAELRRLARRTSKYFQISASGLCLRLDSFEDSSEHRLASCLGLKAQDFFVAETISTDRPVKMVGEWENEKEHPRDTRDGLFSMKMLAWHAANPVTPENEIENDEAQVEAKILPLRCNIDQRAIRFACSFFRGDNKDDDDGYGLPDGLHSVPPPLLQSFRVRPFRLKVDYRPERLDVKALRDGAIVELINLSPLDQLVLTLQQVEIENEVGFGVVIGILLRQWIQDICATQIMKFLTNTRPLEPITHVGRGAADMVVLPWDAFQNGDSIQRAIRAGASSFANAFAYEAFTMTSRLTEFVAATVSRAAAPPASSSNSNHYHMLPSRPIRVPRKVTDTSQHAVESLSRGLQTATYRVVIVPYREYHRSGATGAARSIVKGIPVAIAAPASGAAEALSFALLGVRNQIRPDIRKEEEASQRGLHLDD